MIQIIKITVKVINMYNKKNLVSFSLFFLVCVFSLMGGNSFFYKPHKVSDDQKLPIIYHSGYNIGFFGIENLHPFDAKKYGRVANYLKQKMNVTNQHFFKPDHEVAESDLKKMHAPEYLNSLKSSAAVAGIAEVPVGILPNFLLQYALLKPMRYATQGTIDAAKLALKRGIGINLGGGFHHARSNSGGGFCVYADIPLAMKILRETQPDLKIMYIDLDAHHGDGVASIVSNNNDQNTYIIDAYNEYNYPTFRSGNKISDSEQSVNKRLTSEHIYCTNCWQKAQEKTGRHRAFIHAHNPCKDCNDTYLTNLRKAIPEALKEFEQVHHQKPDIIFYNAGTDCFEEDQLGCMKLSKQDIIDRDEFIFDQAKQHNIPLCMTLSGGYTRKSAEIIGSSLENLYQKQLLQR